MVGQTINALSGSNGLLLNITGHEKITTNVFYVAIIINIVLGMALVKELGAYGVAIASAISFSQWNICLVYFVYKKLKINPTAFTFLGEKYYE